MGLMVEAYRRMAGWLLVAAVLAGAYFAFGRGEKAPPSAPAASRVPDAPATDTIASPGAQPACGGLTPALTEGPYFTAGSPERHDLRELNVPGEPLMITGTVFDQQCQPVVGAWLDFWQADGRGVYDNAGYTLRGHQFTDAQGRYELLTVVPGEYPGRTPHMHVKVQATPLSHVLTTQLFLPGEAGNLRDSIFNDDLVVTLTEQEDVATGTFDFMVVSR